MIKQLLITLSTCTLTLGLLAQNIKPTNVNIEIGYKTFTLPNGLVVIVHEDNSSPVVAINIWYHVGAKDEPPGKEGFAHLFEHMLFKGTEHFDQDFLKAFDEMGATSRGGTTWYDKTNYFSIVPSGSLDRGLWLESERMGYFIGAMTDEKLKKEREVIKSERRLSIEDNPYGRVKELIAYNTYPADHPYSRIVQGSMRDIDGANMEDIKTWYKKYYTPNNAVLVLAGDIDSASAHHKVEKYFNDIPQGPPVVHLRKWVAKRSEEKREIFKGKVPAEKLYKIWNIPEWSNPEYHQLKLIANILATNETSRLNKRLVGKEKMANTVSVEDDPKEIANLFNIEVTARQGVGLSKIEKVLNEELNLFLKQGPTEEELKIAKTDYISTFIRNNERLLFSDWSGRTGILAMGYTYGDNPAFFKDVLNTIRNVSPEELRRTALKWLSDGAYTLEVHQFEESKTTASILDRSKPPTIDSKKNAIFPAIKEFTLTNGLKVMLVERHENPLVYFAMDVDAGAVADQFAVPGIATLTNRMLSSGTIKRSAEQINKERALLGATIETEFVQGFVMSSLEMSKIRMSALKENLIPSLNLFSDLILNPSFTEKELEIKKQQQIDEIKREKLQRGYDIWRQQGYILFGENYLRNNSIFTGTGNEISLLGINRKDILNFYNTWYHPNNATLVVTGDVSLNEIKPLVQKLFGSWKNVPVPQKRYLAAKPVEKTIIYLMDKPRQKESFVNATILIPSQIPKGDDALSLMSDILGNGFGARLNQNLRVNKGWGYFANTSLSGMNYRYMEAYAAVQIDKTSQSMGEILQELKAYITTNPPTQQELDGERNKGNAARWNSVASLAGTVSSYLQDGLIKDLYRINENAINKVTLDEVKKRAAEVIHPDKIIWFITGDKAKILDGIKSLNWGDIIIIDMDGNVLETINK